VHGICNLGALLATARTMAAATSDPYADTSNIGMSAWFVPAEPFGAEFRALIARTAEAHRGALAAGPADLPAFESHVTLGFWNRAVPTATIDAVLADVAAATPPFAVRFDRVAAGAIFFQCVYALCDTADRAVAAPLLAANAEVQRRFGLAYAYMPHMSLAYGDLAAGAKDTLVAELQPAVGRGRTVPIDRIEMWDTSGAVATWRHVKTYHLTGDQRG
jgi:hypothetical protein